MQITFTRTGMSAIVLDVIPGTLQCSDNCIDAGDSVVPKIRTATGISGTCQALIGSSDFTYANAIGLISPSGAGNTNLSGAVSCTNAIVDVSISGDGVQIATISWKGER